jgi:hypothetical protein
VSTVADSGDGIAPVVDIGAYEAAEVIYVNDDAVGLNTGGSWEDAFTDIQDALEAATGGLDDAPGSEIWVAAGTYTPGAQRTESFFLKSDVALYGGFAGTEALTEFDQRDWEANQTILSGEIGTPVPNDNTYRIVRAEFVDGTALLDGFTIQGALADGPAPNADDDPARPFDCASSCGAGINILAASPVLRNLLVQQNQAAFMGGGMVVDYAQVPSIATSAPTLENITFVDNEAYQGGAMSSNNSLIMGQQLRFYDNHAGRAGGAISNVYNSTLTIINAVFDRNIAIGDERGGSAIFNSYGTMTVINAVFVANEFAGNAAIWIVGGTSTTNFYNSIFSNQAFLLHDTTDSSITFADSILQNGCPANDSVDCTNILVADPLFTDADGADNVVGTPDDDLTLQSTSPAIDRGNNSHLDGYDITTDIAGNPRFIDVPWITDLGVGTPPIVDMGAHEYEAYGLTVQGAGTGVGMMTDAAINCAYDGTNSSGDCGEAAAAGTTFAITAAPDAQSDFGGWAGCTSTSGANGEVCNITLDATTVVTATFNPEPVLTVQGTGPGTGSMNAAGITCAYDGTAAVGDCTENIDMNASATIVAAPDQFRSFTGWQGCDTLSTTTLPSDTCQVTLTGSKTVTAGFGMANLIQNGSFEIADSTQPLAPAMWLRSKLILSEERDARVCAPVHSAQEGSCAMQLDADGNGSKLKQDVLISGGVGDTYLLTFYASSTSVGGSGPYRVQIKFYHTDGTKKKYTFKVPIGTMPYTAYSLPAISVQPYTRLQVIIQNGKSRGMAWFDDFTLIRQ